MKYISLVLWTFCLFLLMFSSFPLRVECRPSRVMGPGPPAPATTGGNIYPQPFSQARVLVPAPVHAPVPKKLLSSTSSSPSSSLSSTSVSASVSKSIFSSSSSSSSNTHHHRTACPFLEGPSVWPAHVARNADVYPIDITYKAWGAELVLEATARSRSEVRSDGTYGVTFDVSRIVKGDAPILRRRKQFRLQFLDSNINNANNLRFNAKNSSLLNSSSSTHTNNVVNANAIPSHTNFPRSINSVNSNLVTSGAINSLNFSSIGSSSSTQSKMSISNSQPNQRGYNHNNNNNNNNNNNGVVSASGGDKVVVSSFNNVVKKCSPPKAIIKTGRNYFVFVSKLDNQNHFVPVFSPEFVNNKNTKILNSTFCPGCEQPPGVIAPRELPLESKKRLKLRCRLHKGFPIPTLIWYKDGKLIDFGDSRYRLRAKRRQSILVIRKAKLSAAGLYKCEAKNYLGSAYAITRVTLPKVTTTTTSTTTTTTLPTPVKPPVATTTSRPLPPLSSSPCPYDAYCLNGGTCNYYPSILEYVCQCAEGYKGQRCDVKDIPTSGSMYLSYFCTFGSINPHYPCSPS